MSLGGVIAIGFWGFVVGGSVYGLLRDLGGKLRSRRELHARVLELNAELDAALERQEAINAILAEQCPFVSEQDVDAIRAQFAELHDLPTIEPRRPR